jgi:hypothetical protein
MSKKIEEIILFKGKGFGIIRITLGENK